jgi:chromosomal replication initiator protein
MNDRQLRESTIKLIQEAAAHLFGLSAEELEGESTQRVVAVPRNIAIYITRQLTDATLAQIGQHFGGRHHSTVMNSIATIEKLRRTDVDLDRVLCQLLKSLAPVSKASR